MSVTLRLSLTGKKGQPIYRIVAVETRSKRDGVNSEVLGFYNPSVKPPELKLDNKRFDVWVKNGAIISEGLRKILKSK